MFDPQKAEPVFLEIVKRMPHDAVQVLGETIRLLIAGDFQTAHATVSSGRKQVSPIDPVQKPLSALQQTVLVHNRLHELGQPIPIDRIWAKAAPEASPANRETTVGHDTQKALLDEVRHQLAAASSGTIPCPCCGGGEAVPVGRARMAPAHDRMSTQDQKCRALTRFVDPRPLVDILRTDIANTEADTDTTLRIVLALVERDAISLPVARCSECGLSFVACRLREPVDIDADAGNTAGQARRGAAGTTFLSAFEQALLPHLVWSETDLWAGASVFDFASGSGASLAHHAMAGMRVSGYEDEPSRAAYAREIFKLDAVQGDLAAVEAVAPQSVTCATCDLGLERAPQVGRSLDALCRMVAKNGHVAIVARNGDLVAPADTAAGSDFPLLGGRNLNSLTPAFLGQQLKNRAFEVVRVLRGPGRLDDPNFPVAQRDPFTGVPLWSARPGDFAIVAKRS